MINIYHIMLYFAHISLMHVPNNHFYGYFCDFVGDFSDFGDFSYSSHRKTMVRETALFGTFTSMKKNFIKLERNPKEGYTWNAYFGVSFCTVSPYVPR